MKTKHAFLILALTLIAAPLIPGTAAAHGGGRDWDRSSRWHHEGPHDHGRRGDRDWNDRRDHGHRHDRDDWWGPRVVYRDLPHRHRHSRSDLTIIYNGRRR